MTERIDELEKYYTPIERCDNWAWGLFFISAILSVAIPYSNVIQIAWIQNSISILFILSVVTHSILSHFNSFYLIPKAESHRRKQLLSNSFAVPLTPERTELYYNNEVSPSVTKLAANVMENSFFAKNICNEMAKKERIKSLIYLIIYLFSILNRRTDLDLILILTQVLFSGDIIFRWIKIEFLRFRNESIYSSLYSLFLHKASAEANRTVAGMLDAFASYESAKASASIKQSSKIFRKLNDSLTREWDNIKDELGINDV